MRLGERQSARELVGLHRHPAGRAAQQRIELVLDPLETVVVAADEAE